MITRRMSLFALIAIFAWDFGTAALAGETKELDAKVAQWSPGSSDLLFTSNRDGNGEIYVLRTGTSEWVNLTNHPATDNWAEWSADGKRIVFQSKRTGNLDLWIMNADGSQPTQLTSDAEPDYLPAWSPDGHITFTSWRKEAGESERAPHIYVMNADGSGQRRLVARSLETSAGAAWSPDGKHIVYSRKHGELGANLYVADPDGGSERQLTSGEAYDGSAVFSPDSTQLAFYSDDGTRSALVVVNVDGTGRREVVAAGNNWYPRWSPDGRWLVYTAPVEGSSEDLDVFAVPVAGDGQSVRLVGGPGRESEGRWRPSR